MPKSSKLPIDCLVPIGKVLSMLVIGFSAQARLAHYNKNRDI